MDNEENDDFLDYIPGLIYGTNDDGETVIVSSVDRQDASDVFAAIVTRAYPRLELERSYIQNYMRPVWLMKLPPQSLYNVSDVETCAYNTQMKIYWKHGLLVGYNLVNPEEEEVNE